MSPGDPHSSPKFPQSQPFSPILSPPPHDSPAVPLPPHPTDRDAMSERSDYRADWRTPPTRTSGGGERSRRSSGTSAEAPASSVATGRSSSRGGRCSGRRSDGSAAGSYDGVPAHLEAGGVTGSALADADQLRHRRRRTSPGPTPSKQIIRDHGDETSAPSCTDADADRHRTEAFAEPDHRSADVGDRAPTGARSGTITSNHTTSPGTNSTAPPPLRRRMTSTPAARHAAASTTDSSWAEPEHERRRRHVVPPDRRATHGSGIGRSCRSAAGSRDVQREARTGHDVAQEASGRYGRHVSGMPLTATTTHAVARGARHGRLQPHAGLVGCAVALGEVARTARRRHVLPAVRSALGSRHDVVDRVGTLAAVLAAVVVAGEDRPARQCGTADERHLHHVPEPDDRRARHRHRRGADHPTVVLEHVGLLGQDQTGGPLRGHDAEWLETRVEDERTPHGRTLPTPAASNRPRFARRSGVAPPLRRFVHARRSIGSRPCTIAGSSAHLRVRGDAPASPYCVSIRNEV